MAGYTKRLSICEKGSKRAKRYSITWVLPNWQPTYSEQLKQKKNSAEIMLKSKQKANETHFEVGKKVRQTIQELGGTMPDNLPAPENSIKQLESAAKKLGKNSRNT